MDSKFELLPAEVRRKVVRLLELEHLKRLVSASRIYYQQYLLDRKLILGQALSRALPGVMHDAVAVHQTMNFAFAPDHSRVEIERWLRGYPGWQIDATEYLTEADLIGMTKFHLSRVAPMLQSFSFQALNSQSIALEGHPLTGDPNFDFALSESEQRRILRAIYRFQLGCNLFSKWDIKDGVTKWPSFSQEEICDLFLFKFEPWEIEEILCIHYQVTEFCDQILTSVQKDLDPENPRFDNDRKSWDPVGSFDIANPAFKELWVAELASEGLHFLHKLKFKMTSHEHLVMTIQENIGNNAVAFPGYSVDSYSLRRHDGRSPTERDRRHERDDPLPFISDDDAQGPPFAWTVMWKGLYTNIFGESIDDEGKELRSWGYVMWDKSRMERQGGVRLLEERWGSELVEGADPRYRRY
ncbi:hypothetical protein K461DRAFT_312788 [Myriangium duriaei CBS 260.36]|uniref:Uncharacterized protein n=1 Tax=Myriangium duriaei CBS 260.36 TaxID=1168546 RepID=A0A9P4MGB2_9PEZI|nr:hypothetical protein K461DRAFT_312788 [Myriangium duriaei CBS 260.36]